MPDSIIKADNISSLSGGGIGFPDGSVSNPSLKFTNDNDTGMYRPNSNELGFVTNGSEKLRIEATGQIKATYESQVGTDYNTTLHNGYLCRAWVFANSSSVIQASGNVSSITDYGIGDYQVNFLVAMPDTNYAESIGIGSPSPNVTAASVIAEMRSDGSKTASSIRFTVIVIGSNAKADEAISLMVFR